MVTTDTIDGNSFDVVVIGGGPAGSTIATLLSQAKLRVVVFERDDFPRFHVGESLLPANLPIFDRLGCHETLRQAGFLVKPGATFYDEYEGRGCKTFAFAESPFRPAFAYNVVRAEFDAILLQHAARMGAAVYHACTVDHVHIQPERVVIHIRGRHGEQHDIHAKFLVDASGRAAFVGGRFGQRQPLPDLGRAALFAHFRGVQQEDTIPPGNIRIYLIPQGWLWRIPFANGTDSIGCVLHAKAAKERQDSVTAWFEKTIALAPRLARTLRAAQRLTPIHSAANFSYRVFPTVGSRFVTIGDAAGFVDPVFSTGVFVAMHSAELAATVIRQSFESGDFRARRMRTYATHLHRGLTPFLAFIRHFYDPAFLDLLFAPHPPIRLYQAVLWVLSGAAFDSRPLWVRANLAGFFTVVALRKMMRWSIGLPSQSRWYW